jgi:hypothetical protein
MCRHQFCNRHHAELMAAFYCDREAWFAAREAACADYPGDVALWVTDHPKPQLKHYMINYR